MCRLNGTDRITLTGHDNDIGSIMSPKQCDYNPTLTVENGVPALGGGGSTLEMMTFTVNQMYEHAEWVNELESLAKITAISTRSVDRVRRLQRNLLDSLVILAHVAHRFLRHGDPVIRAVAELLTTGTAFLIGRLCALTWGGTMTRVHR